MGYTMTPQQQQQIHSTLDIDERGKVVFMDFVKLAQEMFAFKLDKAKLETNLMMALTQRDDTEIPPPKKVRKIVIGQFITLDFSETALHVHTIVHKL